VPQSRMGDSLLLEKDCGLLLVAARSGPGEAEMQSGCELGVDCEHCRGRSALEVGQVRIWNWI
jgi:hypothetical protein